MREFAAAMQAVYPVPAGWTDRVTPEVVVCRCEETTAGRLREVVDDLGAFDPRTAKLMARVGMGWCQGRVCGYAASCLVAHWGGGDLRPDLLAERPVAFPVPLGALVEDSGGVPAEVAPEVPTEAADEAPDEVASPTPSRASGDRGTAHPRPTE